ncbi:MAG: DUF4189 domain-containing protein [Pseudomonadota bacterium]|nr:DUF4189 domain-containing protein [Pseudomonadota bacterium]
MRALGIVLLGLATLAGCGGDGPAAPAASDEIAIQAETAPAAETDARAAAPASEEPASPAAPVNSRAADIAIDEYHGSTGLFGAVALVLGPDELIGEAIFRAPSAEDGERAALEACRETAKDKGFPALAEECRASLYFYNACGAVANASNRSWGTGWADSGWRDACKWAETSCRDHGGGDCEGIMYFCSPQNLYGSCDGSMQVDNGVTRIDGSVK